MMQLFGASIFEQQQKILLEIGRWLAVNGEAVYGTRPWKVFGEGPTPVVEGSFNDTKRKAFTGEDFRFTAKKGLVYAVALAWPDNGRMVVKALAKDTILVKDVALLGYHGPLPWMQTAAGLEVKLPAQKPGDHAFTLKIAAD